jgi:hypothetical protein
LALVITRSTAVDELVAALVAVSLVPGCSCCPQAARRMLATKATRAAGLTVVIDPDLVFMSMLAECI